ncbi:DUF3152 domain-containing protein [Bifidobacterium sp. ESL0769]|uniref:DUF3152 domain-containing protein n=1 Tax=Bifidobacterium sp. ESL0769 TaxID=2983229 RepID=UPI0023F8C385|nr:DUF3152 domain-containing protein [Bifidobacterium sp. ESL0769]WEV67658.1 DUF3152 domain-containing protein [Bifidobacterium sp. ESL0769]
MGLNGPKTAHNTHTRAAEDSSSPRKAAHGFQNSHATSPLQDPAISQGFIGTVLKDDDTQDSQRSDGSRDRAGSASRTRRAIKSIYLVRRVAVVAVALVVVIAIVFGCRAVISAVGHHNDSATRQGASSASWQAKQTGRNGKSKPPKPDLKKATVRKPLTDQNRASILATAQKTAAASGKPAHQYSYCVSTKGDVGGTKVQQEFENSIFRTLNDPRGWPRAGASFTYSVDSSNCDFVIYLSQPSLMTTFSGDCSDEYSCRVGDDVIINEDRWNGATPQMLKAGMSLDRYRVMVINHEVGHRLGHIDNEPSCPASNALAPLMQEQSMSLRGCKPNEWPTDSELWIQ